MLTRPAPPSMDEKLARYSERLGLTNEQKEDVRAVLLESDRKGRELRARQNPDQNEIEAAKEEIQKREDVEIMALLTAEQKKAFTSMVTNRRP